MRILLTFAIISATAVAAPGPKKGEKEDKFEGVWKLESKVNCGRLIDFSESNIHMSLDAEGRVICHDGPIKPEGTERGGRFMIDRKKKWFDYVDGSTPEINRAAIYELDGDILQVCSNSRDKDARPDKIEVGPDFVLEKWKRVKPMEKK